MPEQQLEHPGLQLVARDGVLTDLVGRHVASAAQSGGCGLISADSKTQHIL